MGACEGMVHRHPAVLLRRELQEWEIDHPEKVKFLAIRVSWSRSATRRRTRPRISHDGLPFIRAEEKDIAFFEAHPFRQSRFFLLAEEFDDRRLPLAVLEPDVGKPLCAQFRFYPFLPFLELLLGQQRGRPLALIALITPAAIDDGAEYFELRFCERCRSVPPIRCRTAYPACPTRTGSSLHGMSCGERASGFRFPRDFAKIRAEHPFHQRPNFRSR